MWKYEILENVFPPDEFWFHSQNKDTFRKWEKNQTETARNHETRKYFSIILIRNTVGQFMKMFQNCTIAQTDAILEGFHELLRNSNSDHYNFGTLFLYFEYTSFKNHNQTSV